MKNTAEPSYLVMKFGGTSVGSVEAMRKSTGIVASTLFDWPQTVVVLSAMSGVTNKLLEAADHCSSGDIEAAQQLAESLRSRHYETAEGLISDSKRITKLKGKFDSLIEELKGLFGAVGILGEASPRALDAIVSMGERLSVRLFSTALEEIGVKAEYIDSTSLVESDRNHQAAHPDWSATRVKTVQKLIPLLNEGTTPVVTGFLAATPDGVTTTLGRGGSDFSAAIMGAVLQAREVWIWTDVDGVMTADPRIAESAITVSRLSYLELAELAYFGAKVLHPKTIRPIVDAGIGLAIRNTFNPDHPGTRLATSSEDWKGQVIKAVTSIRGQSLITIEGSGMLGVPGVAARAFSAVAATGTNVILISQASSEQSISFAVPMESAQTVIAAVEETFSEELSNREIDRVWATDEVVIVTVVGSGMRHTPGVAGQVFRALGEGGVNVIAIAQGSSEVSISLVVEAGDMEKAVLCLHQLIQ